MKKQTAIVYMVAGLSSRFGGKIKQFAVVGKNGETLIELSLKQATSAGFDKIILIVGKMTEKPFKEMFGSSYNGIPIYYAEQKFDPDFRDKPWGTTDALCCAKDFLDCDFVVCNGDDIYGENTFRILYEHLQRQDEEGTIGFKLEDVLPQKGNVNRGIFSVSRGFVDAIRETFDLSMDNFASRGLKADEPCSQNIFALHLPVLSMLQEKLELFRKKFEGDRKAECLLPSEISNLIREKKIKLKVYHTPDKWIGVTNPEDELIVREFLKNNS